MEVTAEQLVYRAVSEACGSDHPAAKLGQLEAVLYDSASHAFRDVLRDDLPKQFREEFRGNWLVMRDLAGYVGRVADTYRVTS